jgi:uroporphyrin-III C-methyltransferase/precorrin-2 dehydrogenase/sirohydrochlorin ferrochelatase
MTEVRIPKPISHQKMQDLAVLPLFHKLKNHNIIVAGHEVGAMWKAELLAATGANINLFLGAPINEEHKRVFDKIENVILYERKWHKDDMKSCAIAVCQSVSEDDAVSFVAVAKANSVPVNIIDRPEFCDFTFGAIVNRSPLVIGISTDGASPALGQELRGRLEVMLPQKIANWLKLAALWRPKIKALKIESGFKRNFWHNFAKKALDDGGQTPNDKTLEDLLTQNPKHQGRVSLVGAGPGDPELLTIGALRALQSADVILVDDLVSPEIIDFARREADIISVGKRGHKPSNTQDSIIKKMLEHAKAGKNVVRLKGGDVLVFGRATEEIRACEAEGIPIKIIPGISAAQGVAASLGISMTDREYSRKVQYITGSGRNGGLPDDINFQAIADKYTTTFVYMPRHTANEFVEKAIANGLSPQTPAAIIVGATRAGQRNIITNIKKIPKTFASFKYNDPEILIIGDVLKNSNIYKQEHQLQDCTIR